MALIKIKFQRKCSKYDRFTTQKVKLDNIYAEAIDQRKSTFIQVNILAHCPRVRYSHPKVKVKVKLPISLV